MSGTKWTKEEIAWLENNYANNSIAFCADKLNRSVSSVQLKANRIGLSSDFRWKKEDIKYLSDNYPIYGAKKVAEDLGISISKVARKAISLGVKRVNGITSAKVWTLEEEQYLIDNAHLLTKFELAKKLGIDRTTLVRKANKLSLDLLEGKKTCIPWDKTDTDFLYSWYGKISVEEISKVTGKNVSSIIAKARREGLSTTSSETLPEKLVAFALEELGFSYKKQVKIKATAKHVLYRADFLVNKNIIIEVQGDYFHCNPKVYPNGPINSLQEAWIEKDTRKREFYKFSNYELLEIWESDCKDMIQVKSVIKQFVQSRQALVTEL